MFAETALGSFEETVLSWLALASGCCCVSVKTIVKMFKRKVMPSSMPPTDPRYCVKKSPIDSVTLPPDIAATMLAAQFKNAYNS